MINKEEMKERVYRALSSTGSTWLTAEETKKLCKECSVSIEQLKDYGLAVNDEGMATVREVAMEEKAIAVNMMELLVNHKPPQTDEETIRQLVTKFEVEENNGYKLHYHQVDAVIMVVNNSLSILTGGPGTGKTTVLRAIAYVLRKLTAEKITIGYIAPTGKAAKRITESTGEKACTGHTKVGLGCGGQLKKVQERVLFSDESSMADIYLASALSKCIEGDRRLVMVGDVDQLPSVGIGAVLRDMIRSLVIPTTMLTHTFRQDNSSVLFQNIQLVRNGQDNLVKGNDFEPVVLPNGDVSQDCVKRILDSFVKGVKEYGLEQTVVLLPYRRNGVCSNLLNNEIQKIVNPKGKGMKHKDKDGNVRIFRLNDPVMQLENRAEIVNGDVGKVVEVNDMSLKVQYSDCTVLYHYRELDQLTLAYAMSIHKSQGSEYKYVIMALLDSHTAMLQRNLIYTGITRAKTKCTVFYQKKALKKAVTTIAEDSRTTQLTEMLITLHTEYELMNSLVA
jgi:exodeoxyribonuclease V alpha subunit